MRLPVELLGFAGAKHVVRAGAVEAEGGPLDHRCDERDRLRVTIDLGGPGEAGHGGEEIRVSRRVAERAEAALRQAGDRSPPARPDRAQVGVDPGDELVDVEGLPLGRSVGAAVVPVGAPAAAVAVESGVGQHEDHRQPPRRALCVPGLDPV